LSLSVPDEGRSKNGRAY